ncbi:hypothetical protein Fmac_025475 [Flemingia macrophylla]|uniref:glycerophosphodiester phosphodiesterase n=1 Tax=Flemingia macrophylla TaxID=520843 RepID=A0ABD1LSB7_9FABA
MRVYGKFLPLKFREYLPSWHDTFLLLDAMPRRFEDKFVETLQKYGYKGSYLSKDWLKQPTFIQSFAPTSLVYISNKTDLPKVFLIDDVTVPTQDTNQAVGHIKKYFDLLGGPTTFIQSPDLESPMNKRSFEGSHIPEGENSPVII